MAAMLVKTSRFIEISRTNKNNIACLSFFNLSPPSFRSLLGFNFVRWYFKIVVVVCVPQAGFEYVTGEYDDGGKVFRKPKDFVED